jgi:hypothetical protein
MRRSDWSRRSYAHRRLFSFCAPLLMGLASLSLDAQAHPQNEPQDDPQARLLTRQLRLTRDAAGDYRIVESLIVSLGGYGEGAVLSEPLMLVTLPESADQLRELAGELAPDQIGRDGNGLTVVGPIPGEEFQIVFGYRLPAATEEIEFVAEMPVDELVVEIDKGSLDARPQRGLVPTGDGGAAARPYRKYTAHDLAAGAVIAVRLLDGRIDWRQRFAVLMGTGLAAVAAAGWVWRRVAGSPGAPRA